MLWIVMSVLRCMVMDSISAGARRIGALMCEYFNVWWTKKRSPPPLTSPGLSCRMVV